MQTDKQSIAPEHPHGSSPEISGTERQRTLPTGPTGVVRRGASRASNEALAWLAEADVTPVVYDFGVYMAKMVRFATTADGRRKAKPGEVMCYPLQATMARERGCSVRQIKRLVRSLREVGLEVRQRVRPYGATYVFPLPSRVPSGVPSGVPSQREPRTERTKEKVLRTFSELNDPPKRADKGQTPQQRMVCAIATKLDLSNLLTADGLEDFDNMVNTDKQALVKRMLKAEAWHDNRRSATLSARNRSVTGLVAGSDKRPNSERRNRSVTPPRKGRLQADYASRYRSAHFPGSGAVPETGKYDSLFQ